MESAAEKNLLKKRNCSSRVKNGCLNCKSRRRKCDLSKPTCGLCTSTKKNCIYASPFRDSNSTSVSPSHSNHSYPNQAHRSKAIPHLTISPLVHFGQPQDNEARSHFYYFQDKASLEISSLLPPDFWNSYILPLSFSSPPIQYSIVALAAQHREFLRGDSSNDQKYALLVYGHGIRSLNTRLAEWDGEYEKGRVIVEVLVTCLLFICFNLLRVEEENDVAALMHLEAGLKIYALHCDSLSQTLLGVEKGLVSQLISTLRRLDLQAAFYLGPYHLKSAHMNSTSRDLPPFVSILEARGCLEEILVEAYSFLRSTAEPLKYVSMSSTSDLRHQLAVAQRGQYVQKLALWLQAFHLSQHETKNEEVEAAKLSISHARANIALSVCLSPSETAYDAHLSLFMGIIANAEFILGSQQTRPLFDLEMCLVEVLYYTALKCREESTRWKAVELLGRTGKEGVWEGRIMKLVAEFVVRSEVRKEVLVGDEKRDGREKDRIHGTEVDVRRERREIGVKCSKKRSVAGGMERCANEGEANRDCFWEFFEAVLKY